MDGTKLANEREKLEWLRDDAGTCIDALEAALNSFSARDLESLIALRRQVGIVLQKARQLDLAALANAAEHSLEAGVLDIRMGVEGLIALLRKAAHVGRTRLRSPAEEDRVTGLLNADGFVRRLASIESGDGAQAAVAAIRVTDRDELVRPYGGDISEKLDAHVGNVLSGHLRSEDFIARMGTLEFAILLPTEDHDGLQTALSRIETAMAGTPFKFPDGRTAAIAIVTSGFNLDGVAHATEQTAATSQAAGAHSIKPPRPMGGTVRRVGVAVRNDTTAAVIAGILERAGYAVVHAGNHGNGRMLPFAIHKVHAVIVEDGEKELPTTLSALRSALARRRTPIIFLAENVELGQRALANGAREVLPKPVRPETLLASVTRLILRGRSGSSTVKQSPANGLLVASDDISQLIALGSSLQKQAGYHVCLGRGWDDAVTQARRHNPVAVLIDMPIRHDTTRKLLDSLAGMDPAPPVILIVGETERFEAGKITSPRIAATLARPVVLRALHTDVQRAMGNAVASMSDASHDILRKEILRVMRTSMVSLPVMQQQA